MDIFLKLQLIDVPQNAQKVNFIDKSVGLL